MHKKILKNKEDINYLFSKKKKPCADSQVHTLDFKKKS